jgi:hypothetical protein
MRRARDICYSQALTRRAFAAYAERSFTAPAAHRAHATDAHGADRYQCWIIFSALHNHPAIRPL